MHSKFRGTLCNSMQPPNSSRSASTAYSWHLSGKVREEDFFEDKALQGRLCEGVGKTGCQVGEGTRPCEISWLRWGMGTDCLSNIHSQEARKSFRSGGAQVSCSKSFLSGPSLVWQPDCCPLSLSQPKACPKAIPTGHLCLGSSEFTGYL